MTWIDAIKVRLIPNIISVLKATNTKTYICVFCWLRMKDSVMRRKPTNGHKLTVLFFIHSSTRFLPSFRDPMKLGYSGSCMVLGNMYWRPPPRMTWTCVRRLDLIFSFTLSKAANNRLVPALALKWIINAVTWADESENLIPKCDFCQMGDLKLTSISVL